MSDVKRIVCSKPESNLFKIAIFSAAGLSVSLALAFAYGPDSFAVALSAAALLA